MAADVRLNSASEPPTPVQGARVGSAAFSSLDIVEELMRKSLDAGEIAVGPTSAPDCGERIDDFSLECSVESIPGAEQAEVVVDACPICGVDRGRPRFAIARGRFQVLDCTGCGLGRLHPLPDAKAISEFYPASYYGVTGAKFVPLVEWLVRLVGARHVRHLSRGLSRGARVLDVGCGRGVLLSALADRGFEVHGFEISEAAAAGADRRAAVRIGGRLEEAAYPDSYFDQAILWHVLEHLPEPAETLREIRRILKPQGRLVVAVPNYSSSQARWAGPAWFHLDPPRHLYHFPVAGLRRLLEQCEFSCRTEHHFSLRQNPFGWVQSGLNRFPRLPRNGLYSMLKSRGAKSPRYDRRTCAVLRAAYWLGMPAACVMSVLDALRRDGASVCIVAEARRS